MYAVPDAVVKAVLAAVISKSIDYFSEFVGIPFIISPASAAAAHQFSNNGFFIIINFWPLGRRILRMSITHPPKRTANEQRRQKMLLLNEPRRH